MKKLIELHDSFVANVTINGSVLIISLKPLVILHVTDVFGFEFDKTEYLEGTIEIHNFSSDRSLTTGVIFDGYLQVEECQYPLIPYSLNVEKKCVLFLTKESGSIYVFGDKVVVQVNS
jgi:hypothetical protein